MRYPCNLGAVRHEGMTFRPDGPIYHNGAPEVLDGVKKRMKRVVGVRMFVGFNVGDTPRWSINDLVEVVRTVRLTQGADASATILAQRGIYQHKGGTDALITEEGAQVIILNLDGTAMDTFVDQMVALAEQICVRMYQSEVLVEIQVNGVVRETLTVVAGEVKS